MVSLTWLAKDPSTPILGPKDLLTSITIAFLVFTYQLMYPYSQESLSIMFGKIVSNMLQFIMVAGL
jgi:hypothetical protein